MFGTSRLDRWKTSFGGPSWTLSTLTYSGAAPVSSVASPGLVVLGGPMNVDQTDKYPFLADEVDWIRAALAAQMPV